MVATHTGRAIQYTSRSTPAPLLPQPAGLAPQDAPQKNSGGPSLALALPPLLLCSPVPCISCCWSSHSSSDGEASPDCGAGRPAAGICMGTAASAAADAAAAAGPDPPSGTLPAPPAPLLSSLLSTDSSDTRGRPEGDLQQAGRAGGTLCHTAAATLLCPLLRAMCARKPRAAPCMPARSHLPSHAWRPGDPAAAAACCCSSRCCAMLDGAGEGGCEMRGEAAAACCAAIRC